MTEYRIRLQANEIKPRLQLLKKKALFIEPKLAARINEIGTTLSKYKNEILEKKRFLIDFLNEFYYDIQTYLHTIQPLLKLSPAEREKFCQQKNISVTEYYWYTVILPKWLSQEDPKFSYWVEKLIQEEYTGNDEDLIFNLTKTINSRTDGSASNRYILDLSMATDLLVSHVPSTLEPVFVQLTGISNLRDGQPNPDFLNKQQRWNNTLSCWGIKRALLVAHDAQVNSPNHLLKLADVMLKESSDRPNNFITVIPFPG
ncbi:hypothetical protein [Sphaerospermopsis torques-reginae]|uniref:Uncharacterized protein n=1 Tax=Sphaerospermopsis torques-reginae ITEP-024 TaxID=984208 RepID=A0ABX8WTX8_9CYAN|nr:hypothetical protein [Sphaerospermopsis torques-reginae]QYX29840.1 hypothetical protein K2F26_12660 [Sphaerospermopsis torques-reginae ITEP-024]